MRQLRRLNRILYHTRLHGGFYNAGADGVSTARHAKFTWRHKLDAGCPGVDNWRPRLCMLCGMRRMSGLRRGDGVNCKEMLNVGGWPRRAMARWEWLDGTGGRMPDPHRRHVVCPFLA